MAKYSTCTTNEAMDILADKYELSREEYIIIQKFINLKATKRADVADCILNMAAAIRGDRDFALVISPETATKEEKKEAFQEYLDAKNSGQNIIPIKFFLVEPTWKKWI